MQGISQVHSITGIAVVDPDEESSDGDGNEEDASIAEAGTSGTSIAASTYSKTERKYLGKEIDVPKSANVRHIGDKLKCEWEKPMPAVNSFFPDNNYYDCITEVHVLFKTFFDDKVLQFIVDGSNKYAILQQNIHPHITVRVFLGIIIISWYNHEGDTENYCSKGPGIHNEIITCTMPCNRFSIISKYIYVSSLGDENVHDRMWKLRPLITKPNQRFLKNFHPEQNLSYDESIITYYGRHIVVNNLSATSHFVLATRFGV